jgi:hypothetical protein
MNLRNAILAVLAGSAALVAAPAFADRDHRHGNSQWKHHKHHGHHSRPVVVVPRYYYAPPPRVYYAPPPAVVYPAPAYYPAPVYRHEPGVSIRFSLPL